MYHVIDSKDDSVFSIEDTLADAKTTCDSVAANKKRPFYVDKVERVWSSQTLDELLKETA